MSSDPFDGQLLADKLSKLNNSQQSIESLSRWCIHHRDKARKIIETWEKLFNSRQREQRVSFLYLANDILQNSRRLGNEFVSEFWKVLPSALKQVYDNGDEQGRVTVTRLVTIWEQRKVFGSRGPGLKDELLGKSPQAPLSSNGKSSNVIKIVKKDAQSLRIKLAAGSLPEKIISAFQSVLDEQPNEENHVSSCNAAVINADKLRGEAEIVIQGNQYSSTLMNELQEQEHVLQQCVEKLESAEASRLALLSQLKEAIQDQEMKLAIIQSQLQIARSQIDLSANLRKRMASGVHNIGGVPSDQTIAQEIVISQAPMQPMVSFAPLRAAEEDNKKAAAAAMAAKLTASTSSAQMLTSVLSSLVAEEAASMNSFPAMSHFQPEKRQKMEKTALDSVAPDAAKSSYFASAGIQMPAAALSQSSFGTLPPLPLPPQSQTPAGNQYVGVMTYGYGNATLPPPPPLPPHIGLARPGSQPQQGVSTPQQQLAPPSQLQKGAAGGYYRPPGIGFYGQAPPPPVPRQ